MQPLVNAAANDWAAFDGWCASHLGGADPMDLPLTRFLNLIYYYLIKNADAEQRSKFDARLWIPPKGEAPAEGSVWSAESETAAFAAFAAQVGVSGPQAAATATPGV